MKMHKEITRVKIEYVRAIDFKCILDLCWLIDFVLEHILTNPIKGIINKRTVDIFNIYCVVQHTATKKNNKTLILLFLFCKCETF